MRSRDADGLAPLAYRGTFMLAVGAFCIGVAVWFVLDALDNLGRQADRIGAAASLLGAVLIFAVAIRPALIADRERVLVRNPFRTVSVPWSRVVQFTMRYSLDVDTEDRSYSSWAVSRPSWRRQHAVVAGPRPTPPISSQAVEELTQRLEMYRTQAAHRTAAPTDAAEPGSEPGPEADADADQVTPRWSWPTLGALALALVLLVLAMAVP
jgi:Bacterial PH domain